jgi:hypothetical protein
MATAGILTTPQLEEWLRSDPTKALIANLKERANWLELQRRQLYFPNEPFRTQEAIVGVDGHQAEIASLLQLFESVETLEDALNERYHERQRSLAGRLSGTGPT